jgi:hypothetical protein
MVPTDGKGSRSGPEAVWSGVPMQNVGQFLGTPALAPREGSQHIRDGS